jgi:phage antirepressor YoqD-like protein
VNTTNNNTTPEIKIKPYTAGELATLYGVSKKTLNTWLLPHREYIGEKKSLYYTAKQVRIIFEELGEP